jgi:uncharacterized damage-inducible protein DinB
MVTRTKWIDHKFTFDFPVGHFPGILERLRGTPARIEELVAGLNERRLTDRGDGPWSIKEHVGHLVTTEELFSGRLDDFLAGAATLRPADLSGRRTNVVDYNRKSTVDILAAVRSVRREFVARLEQVDDVAAARIALHPRLNTPMRLVDMVYFAAEHDDHHLAAISELLRGSVS